MKPCTHHVEGEFSEEHGPSTRERRTVSHWKLLFRKAINRQSGAVSPSCNIRENLEIS